MIELDGSMGEGGGQVLRSALALSVATGRPFRMGRIRARRDVPGLRAQHLTAVRAAAEVGRAQVEGAEKGSEEVVFRPRGLKPGRHRFSTGTAGSATLVFQTVAPPLALADEPSTLVLEGGTHNPHAPPYEFLAWSFLPLLERTGVGVEAELERPGFYPAGGGRFRARIRPGGGLEPLLLEERGPETGRRARAIVSALPRHIAEREVSIAHAMLGMRPDALEVVEVSGEEAAGPGNAVMIEVSFQNASGVFTGFGRRGKPAEEVAREASREALGWIEAGVPVGPRLADQLLVPLAVGAGGRFLTCAPTSHTRTNAEVVRRLAGAKVVMEELEERADWRVEVKP